MGTMIQFVGPDKVDEDEGTKFDGEKMIARTAFWRVYQISDSPFWRHRRVSQSSAMGDHVVVRPRIREIVESRDGVAIGRNSHRGHLMVTVHYPPRGPCLRQLR
jgi:hypothetical protein